MLKYKAGIWLPIQLLSLSFLLLFPGILKAQPDPPRPLKVTLSQNISFGAFTHGPAGGTITINPGSSRSSGGSVVLLNLGFIFSSGRFDIVGNPGTLVTLLINPSFTLNGSNGGTMILSIDSTNPVSPFVITNPYPLPTQMTVGGTLTVGNSGANPPGSYSGTFEIIFNQQ